jgi:hypothetical protein
MRNRAVIISTTAHTTSVPQNQPTKNKRKNKTQAGPPCSSHVPICHHFEKSFKLEFTFFHTFRGEEKSLFFLFFFFNKLILKYLFIYKFIYLMSFLQTIELKREHVEEEEEGLIN